MKKTLIALVAVIFATSTAHAASSFGQWANDTANAINKKEAEINKSVTDRQNAYKKQQAEAQAKREAQKKEFEALGEVEPR